MRLALNPTCSEPTGEAIMEGSPPLGDGADLLGAVTREEVVVALIGLRNYKASGFSGCPTYTELLKYAILNDDPSIGYQVPSDVDVPQHLATMLDVCFQTGRVPAEWNRMLVSPVFKKGDKADLANYRPISVSNALAKLYAMVLNNRLLPWLPSNQGVSSLASTDSGWFGPTALHVSPALWPAPCHRYQCLHEAAVVCVFCGWLHVRLQLEMTLGILASVEASK